MKRHMQKRIWTLILIFVLLFSKSAGALYVSAPGAYSLNCNTGEVYYSKNGDVPMTPASITKVMTLDEFFARNHDVIDLETEEASEEANEEIAFDAPDYSDYAIPPMDILCRDLPCNEESTDREMQEISEKILAPVP